MRARSPEAQLDAFIGRYSPAIQALARHALERLRARLPGAVQLVYDNYNALVIGFSPTERPSAAVFSVALYPRWVTLFFLHGAALADPDQLLKGAGRQVRHIVLHDNGNLDDPRIIALMNRALDRAGCRLDDPSSARLVIRSVSAHQRPRRPTPKRRPPLH